MRGGQPGRALELTAAVWNDPPPHTHVRRLQRVLSGPLAYARALMGEADAGLAELETLVGAAERDGDADLVLAQLHELRAGSLDSAVSPSAY